MEFQAWTLASRPQGPLYNHPLSRLSLHSLRAPTGSHTCFYPEESRCLSKTQSICLAHWSQSCSILETKSGRARVQLLLPSSLSTCIWAEKCLRLEHGCRLLFRRLLRRARNLPSVPYASPHLS